MTKNVVILQVSKKRYKEILSIFEFKGLYNITSDIPNNYTKCMFLV